MKLTQEQARLVEKKITDKADNIILAKRHDYSGPDDPYANFRRSTLFGVEPWRGVMIRLSDKLSRILSIMEAKGESKVKDETLLDTLADAVNYTRILGGMVAETLQLTEWWEEDNG